MRRKARIRQREYEIECAPGLEDCVMAELRGLAGGELSRLRVARPGFLRFSWRGETSQLNGLRSAIALYQMHRFDVPRPKALLGHQHFTRLSRLAADNCRNWDHPPSSFGIGAAGADTAVMRRLKRELSRALNLPLAADDKGELYLRLTRDGESGWAVLARTTALPLAKRGWRRVNVPGALNATVAYAMTRMGKTAAGQRVVNLCCGSATIAIEHAMSDAAAKIIALDCDPHMLAAARQNILASGVQSGVELLQADATKTPLPDATVERLYADLPFGHYIGSHEDNARLYPALLREAARIAKPEATFSLITHEIRLMRRCLASADWRVIEERRINLSGLHPRIFVLRRKPTSV